MAPKKTRPKRKSSGAASSDNATPAPKPPLACHRARFFNWAPSPVVALAARPGSDTAVVCVARGDGSLELVDGDARWSQTLRVAGRRDVVATSLAWVGGAVYGGTASGVLFRADFAAGALADATDALGGAVWDLATDPRAPARLDACCDDGTLRVFDAAEDGALAYVGALRAAAGARALCCAWAALGGERAVFCGCDDGSVRRVDARTGGSGCRMTVERGPNGEDAAVWCVAVVDHREGEDEACVVASGDSTGAVCLWDGALGVLLRRFRRHEGDVLCLATVGGARVFASGVDAKVACVERGGDGAWTWAAAHRPHVLDVRALCATSVQRKGGRVATLVSGGLDAKLCTYAAAPGAPFPAKRPARLWPFPDRSVVAAAPGAGLAACVHGDRVDVWRLRAPPELALRVAAADSRNLAFACLADAPAGGEKGEALLVFGDCERRARCLHVFDAGDPGAGPLRAAAVAGARGLPPAAAAAVAGGAVALLDAKRGRVALYDLRRGADGALELVAGGCIAFDAALAPSLVALRGGVVAVARRGGAAAVARRGDAAFAPLAGAEACGAVAVASRGLVVAACLDPARPPLVALDADAARGGGAAPAATAAAQAVLDAAARLWAPRKDALVGLCANDDDVVLAYSHGAVLRADCRAAAPDAPADAPAKRGFNPFKKRRPEAAPPPDHGAAASLTARYTPILDASWLDASSLLVAECPWLDVARSMAAAPIERKQFGK